MDDMIDFPCSDIWLNHYHDKKLTPRFKTEDFRADIAYWDRELKLRRQEYEKYKISDEVYFRDREHTELVQRMKRQYEERIRALERHIDYLSEKKAPRGHGSQKFEGIKVESPWTSQAEDEKTHS